MTVRREGGLRDLLEAASNGRPFDAVIVESIDRLSRMTADATRIEGDLEDRDVALFAADEPMTASSRRSRRPADRMHVRPARERC